MFLIFKNGIVCDDLFHQVDIGFNGPTHAEVGVSMWNHEDAGCSKEILVNTKRVACLLSSAPIIYVHLDSSFYNCLYVHCETERHG